MRRDETRLCDCAMRTRTTAARSDNVKRKRKEAAERDYGLDVEPACVSFVSGMPDATGASFCIFSRLGALRVFRSMDPTYLKSLIELRRKSVHKDKQHQHPQQILKLS
eukprot:ANDGO_02884.mRNA.1 hypothetical protein